MATATARSAQGRCSATKSPATPATPSASRRYSTTTAMLQAWAYSITPLAGKRFLATWTASTTRLWVMGPGLLSSTAVTTCVSAPTPATVLYTAVTLSQSAPLLQALLLTLVPPASSASSSVSQLETQLTTWS